MSYEKLKELIHTVQNAWHHVELDEARKAILDIYLDQKYQISQLEDEVERLNNGNTKKDK